MPGKPSLLCFTIGVIAEASLPLQIENECSHLLSAYLGDISAQALATQEIVEISHAISDNGYGIGAFTFGSGTELVTLKQSS